jgi:hypothetical protein
MTDIREMTDLREMTDVRELDPVEMESVEGGYVYSNLNLRPTMPYLVQWIDYL